MSEGHIKLELGEKFPILTINTIYFSVFYQEIKFARPVLIINLVEIAFGREWLD